MTRPSAVIRSAAAGLCAIACSAMKADEPEVSVPPADVPIYRAALAALPPPPAGMTSIVFKVNRATRPDADFLSMPTADWTCSDGSDPAAALARYAAMPARPPGEILPAEAMTKGYQLVRERSAGERRSNTYHGGDRKYEVGDVTAFALRRGPDGRTAAILFLLALPEYGLVELEPRDGSWQAIRHCEPPLPGAPKPR
jgi:hypothetical protein